MSNQLGIFFLFPVFAIQRFEEHSLKMSFHFHTLSHTAPLQSIFWLYFVLVFAVEFVQISFRI